MYAEAGLSREEIFDRAAELRKSLHHGGTENAEKKR